MELSIYDWYGYIYIIYESMDMYNYTYVYTGDPSVLAGMLDVDNKNSDNVTSGSDVKDFTTSSPLAGLGYGLPIAR